MKRTNAHTHRISSRLRLTLTALLLAAVPAAACSGDDGGIDEATSSGSGGPNGKKPGGSGDEQTPYAFAPARRLSNREIGNSIEMLTGVVPSALAQLPPDGRDHLFDRIYQSQTVSSIHIDAFAAISSEVLATLLAERKLDDIAPACRDEILPPAAPSTRFEHQGVALNMGPEWALCPGGFDCSESLMTMYAPAPFVTHQQDIAANGTYRVALSVESNGNTSVNAKVDGATVTTGSFNGKREIVYDMELTAGAHSLRWDFSQGNNSWLRVHRLEIEGPVDPGAEVHAAERDACAEALIVGFTPQVFRRPVTSDELDELRALYQAGRAVRGFWDGIGAVFDGLMLSPHFLYLVERGTEGSGHEELTAHELASRLSYGLCEQPPDGELRAAADDGSILDPDELRAQAGRLLGSSCGREMAVRFLEQWLWLDRLAGAARDPAVYPDFSAEVRDALGEEVRMFLEAQSFDEEASVAELFTTDRAFASRTTADFYGADVSGGEPSPIALPPERRGVLGHPATLTVTGKFNQTSPVQRGVFALRNLLCLDMPSPPPGVDITPPELDPTMTTRERWEAHSTDPVCSSCHRLIDPIGFALESFDAIGRFRIEENGALIDTSGGIPSLGIEAGSLTGQVELAQALAETAELKRCFARQWLRHGLGRLDEPNGRDEALLNALTESATEQSIQQTLLELVTSDSFRRRRPAND